ncbi:hypothetical protein NDU88_010185 [Pleurodeles waltl]|uniref:Uncharacterized protein n=1 Tax=Pleurodeles waltl TaxID=8319 RepID=A0AAV7PZB5_PLEWA|nr:hypothetical protein NDU88_010185 [Pleurodeles waltl]
MHQRHLDDQEEKKKEPKSEEEEPEDRSHSSKAGGREVRGRGPGPVRVGTPEPTGSMPRIKTKKRNGTRKINGNMIQEDHPGKAVQVMDYQEDKTDPKTWMTRTRRNSKGRTRMSRWIRTTRGTRAKAILGPGSENQR